MKISEMLERFKELIGDDDAYIYIEDVNGLSEFDVRIDDDGDIILNVHMR